MSLATWQVLSGRLATLGASTLELAAIQAAYFAMTAATQAALDTLTASLAGADLLVMLNTWRTSGSPFHAGLPGGGLPFGTGVAVLTGNPSDDASAISAGTGRPLALSTVSPTGGDDTSLINAATAAGHPLAAASTFLFSGTITAMPTSAGPGVVLRATSTAAHIQHGPALGSASLTDPSRRGGFVIDGNSLASAQPLLTANSVSTRVDPVSVKNWGGSGPSIVIGGQNCTWDNLTGDVALDAGAGGHQFNNPEWPTLVIRETVTPPAQAYLVPQQNRVWGGRIENAPAASYSVHQTAGQDVHLHGTIIFNPAVTPLVPLVFIEPDVNADTNGRLYFHGCTFQGGTSALASSSTALGGDFAALLDGHTYFLGQSGGIAIPWTNATQIVLNGDYTLGGATTTVYSGSGSAPKAISNTIAAYPKRLDLDTFDQDVIDGAIIQGTWIWTIDVNADNGGYTQNTSSATNDELDFTVDLSGGVWKFEIMYRVGTNGGQFTVYLDGVAMGSFIEGYSASASDNNRVTYTSITVPVGGEHTIAVKVTGKNGSSGGQWAMVQGIYGRRTA